jgi:hypothetical protein
LKSGKDEMQASDDVEDGMDEDDDAIASRAKLAQADDFDFDDL